MRLLVASYRRCETIYRSRLPGSKVSLLTGLLYPWRWDQYVIPKRRILTANLRWVTSQKRDYTAAKQKSHIALFYCTGKKYVPRLGLVVSILNSHDVPTEKVAGASHVTSTVTRGNKVKKVAYYIHMEFAYSKICFILFSMVLFVGFSSVRHCLITLSTVGNKVYI
jgi:hypothetical protein